MHLLVRANRGVLVAPRSELHSSGEGDGCKLLNIGSLKLVDLLHPNTSLRSNKGKPNVTDGEGVVEHVGRLTLKEEKRSLTSSRKSMRSGLS